MSDEVALQFLLIESVIRVTVEVELHGLQRHSEILGRASLTHTFLGLPCLFSYPDHLPEG